MHTVTADRHLSINTAGPIGREGDRVGYEVMVIGGGTGRICAGALGFTGVRRPVVVEAVDAENVDGTAIRDAFLSTDMTVEGFGNTWRYGEDVQVIARTMKMYKWDLDRAEFVNLGGEWITPGHWLVR